VHEPEVAINLYEPLTLSGAAPTMRTKHKALINMSADWIMKWFKKEHLV